MFLIFHISFGKASLTDLLPCLLACLRPSFLSFFLPSFLACLLACVLPSFLSSFLPSLLTYLLKLSTRFDSDVAINLMLSKNFTLHDINSVVLLLCLMIFTPFFIEMEKVLHFSLFFCNTVKLTIKFTFWFFDDQMKSILRAVMKNYMDFIGHIEF